MQHKIRFKQHLPSLRAETTWDYRHGIVGTLMFSYNGKSVVSVFKTNDDGTVSDEYIASVFRALAKHIEENA